MDARRTHGDSVARHGGDNLSKVHCINKDIKENKALSVNVVDKGWLAKANYTGCVAGKKTDKSALFAYTAGETGAPMIGDAILSMECTVEDVYELGAFENFMIKVKTRFPTKVF